MSFVISLRDELGKSANKIHIMSSSHHSSNGFGHEKLPKSCSSCVKQCNLYPFPKFSEASRMDIAKHCKQFNAFDNILIKGIYEA